MILVNILWLYCHPINYMYMADYFICMGSSIGIASGISKTNKQKLAALIGDSTFFYVFYVGIPPLINIVHQKAKIMVAILDNWITAMTDGQPNPGILADRDGKKGTIVFIE